MEENHPWLQTRRPEDLERTDLGYGEDLKTTTVPTHDLPNEEGFTPEKFGMWKETAIVGDSDMWPAGHKLLSAWAYDRRDKSTISNLTHPGADTHFDMFDDGYIDDDPEDPNLLKNWAFGHLYHNQGDPPSHLVSYDSDWINAKPDENLSEQERTDIKNNLDAALRQSGSPELNHTAAQIIPQAHRMIWLTQPTDRSLKYWHHRPSNTTYIWDDFNRHHMNMAPQVENLHGISPWHNNDWEGGFYEQNGFGKHPADLWGLPSSTDYATVQGDGDYGNSVF